MSTGSPDPVQRLTTLLSHDGEMPEPQRNEVFGSIYAELRRLARRFLAQERVGHTLQATALVHEAWLRLFGNREPFASSQDFLAAASMTMRRVLVDHARTRGRAKRGGQQRRMPIDALELATIADADTVLAVDEAMRALEQRDPQLAEQAKLRLFAGLDDDAIAMACGVSDRTVRRDWVLARAFLQQRLQADA